MAETSSPHCFLRCLTRCFGYERQRRRNDPKTMIAAEPMENGFSHIDKSEKANGSVPTVVKICQPSSNGFNKQLRNVGEKACCVPQTGRTDDEIPYTYEAVPTTADLNGSLIVDDIDNSKGNVAVVNENGLSYTHQNGGANHNLQLSNNDQLQFKDTIELDHTQNHANSSVTQGVTPVATPIVLPKDCDVVENNITEETNFKDIFPKSDTDEVVVANNNCGPNGEGISLFKPEGDLKDSRDNFDGVCNGDVPKSDRMNLHQQNGDNKETLLQNGQSNEGDNGILHFKNLVKNETIKLEDVTQKWEKVLSNVPDIHEEVQDEIRSVIGQTHLVLSERFTQFKSLVEQSERQANGEQTGTKVITLTDLQGFWDMIYFQVQDVIAKFERLDRVQNNGWNHEILHENDKKPAPKKNVRKPANARNKRTAKTTTGQPNNNISDEEKARRLAARKRLAEARKKMAALGRTQPSNGENFIVQ